MVYLNHEKISKLEKEENYLSYILRIRFSFIKKYEFEIHQKKTINENIAL